MIEAGKYNQKMCLEVAKASIDDYAKNVADDVWVDKITENPRSEQQNNAVQEENSENVQMLEEQKPDNRSGIKKVETPEKPSVKDARHQNKLSKKEKKKANK